MPSAITDIELFDALNHALGRVHEFDGGGIDAKLAVFGLQADAVHRLLQQRWVQYRDDHEDSGDANIVFVRAFVEGLLTGMQLGARRASP